MRLCGSLAGEFVVVVAVLAAGLLASTAPISAISLSQTRVLGLTPVNERRFRSTTYTADTQRDASSLSEAEAFRPDPELSGVTEQRERALISALRPFDPERSLAILANHIHLQEKQKERLRKLFTVVAGIERTIVSDGHSESSQFFVELLIEQVLKNLHQILGDKELNTIACHP